MSQIPENVLQVLVQLVPASILNDITCYVFYDNHPRDVKKIDITVCTKMGEVREYFQRHLLSSVKLKTVSVPSEIRILRNDRCELFYLVASSDELTILSSRDKLQVQSGLTDVSRYDISDSGCSGQASLKVVCKNSEIPLIPDDNFENFKCLEFSPSFTEQYDSEPIVTHLMRKLTEAKYCVKCNEKSYMELLKFRQAVAFSTYKKMHPNLDDSIFKESSKKMASALAVHTQNPWIKTCNKKVVIVYTICNRNDIPLEDVHILLHCTSQKSIEYTTKIYELTNSPPFWNETKSQILKPNIESAVIVLIDLEDIKDSVVSKMALNGIITYKMLDKECILPIDEVNLSPFDTMGEQFDVLCSDPMDDKIMLAVLASTEKNDLILRLIKTDSLELPNDQYLTVDMFCKYLKMEQVLNTENIVIHRRSPYHILNGVMIKLGSERRWDHLPVTVYSRSPSQILALIHLIHDAVPYNILITTPFHKVTAKNDDLSIYNENSVGDVELVNNYQSYTSSMLNRTDLVLQYLDNSLIHMNESKDPVVLSKIGTEIDLFPQGDLYKDFKEKMHKEAEKGVKMLNHGLLSVVVSDEMSID